MLCVACCFSVRGVADATQAAEEKKIAVENSDAVPLPVLKDFAIEFVRGLTRLMHRLGFKRDTIVSEL